MIQLVITLADDGVINVQGPINNKLLCYGILESARDAIRDFVPADKNGIIPVRTPLVVPKNRQ